MMETPFCTTPSPSKHRSRTSCNLCGANNEHRRLLQKGKVSILQACHVCHLHFCSSCFVWRRYGPHFPTTEAGDHNAGCLPVCQRCLAKPNLVLHVPRCVWELIFNFCDAASEQRLLQLCHATQMGVVLPYPYSRYGWNTFFQGKNFISKGANGEVYRATVRDDIGKELSRYPIAGLDANSLIGIAGRTVAVKAIRKSTVFSLRKWEHIQREIDALRRCRHRHVVHLHFVAQGPSEVYIVLQYVAGGDLFDWLVRQQVPMEHDVVIIARQLLETLHFMHEVCGVVHRDIKPENILLQPHAGDGARSRRPQDVFRDEGDHLGEYHDASDDLYIQLTDFGYARLLPEHEGVGSVASSAVAFRPPWLPRHREDAALVGTAVENNQQAVAQLNLRKQFFIASTPCGTLGFAAPEILSAYNARKSNAQRFRSNDEATRQAQDTAKPQTPVDLVKSMDIFAAGVTICILLTGCEPFPCSSSKEHVEAVHEGLDFSGPQWSFISQSAKSLLRRMVASKASERPSALECLNSTWLAHHGSYATVTSVEDEDHNDPQTKELHPSASMWKLLSTSFQDSVRSLRKNDGWLFVQDAQGLVTTIPRHCVSEKEDTEVFPT